jgi:hypothetical protein
MFGQLTQTPYHCVFDFVCELLQNQFTFRELNFLHPHGMQIHVENELYHLKGKRLCFLNCVKQLQDNITPVITPEIEQQFNITHGQPLLQYIYQCQCQCHPNCKKKVKIIHKHQQCPSICVNDENHHDKGKEQSKKNLPHHPYIDNYISQHLSDTPEQILKHLTDKRDENQVDQEDGRYSLNKRQIIQKKSYINKAKAKTKESDEQKTAVLVTNSDSILCEHKNNFDPNDFNMVIIDNSLNQKISNLMNLEHLGYDSVYKLTEFDVPISPFVTVDHYGHGVIVAIGVSSNLTKEKIQKQFDFVEENIKSCKQDNKIERVTIDALHSAINYLKGSDKEFFICKFHILQASEKHMPSDKHKKEQIRGILKRMFLCKDEEHYEDLKREIDEVDHNFYKYFVHQWYTLHNNFTRINATSQFRLLNTNNYTESAIKSLAHFLKPVSGQGITKRSLHETIIKIMQKMRTQGVNDKFYQTNTDQELQKALKKAQNKEMSVREIDDNDYVVNNRYLIHISCMGLSCSCKSYFKRSGRPCKHIFQCLLARNERDTIFDDEDMNDGMTMLQTACQHFGINPEMNAKSVIPHFIPQSGPQTPLLISTNRFKARIAGRKKRKRIAIHPCNEQATKKKYLLRVKKQEGQLLIITPKGDEKFVKENHGQDVQLFLKQVRNHVKQFQGRYNSKTTKEFCGIKWMKNLYLLGKSKMFEYSTGYEKSITQFIDDFNSLAQIEDYVTESESEEN